VYAVGHSVQTRHGPAMAAVLACGPEAVLSHVSAAQLWGLRRSGRAEIDVTVPGHRAGCRGIRVRRVNRLHREDWTLCERIPVTTVPRTLLDCAVVLTPRQLRNDIEAAERLRVFDLGALEATCERSRGHHGVKALRAALADVHGEPPITRSDLELLFLDFCRARGIPLPATNVTVCGYEVDAAWVDRQLIVELDSYEFHGTRGAFERDRERDTRLQLARFRVIRVTQRRITRDGDRLEDDIRSFFAL
jgi:hypothetical protein